MRIALASDHAGRFTPGPHHSAEMMDELIGALVEIWDRLELKLAA